MNPKGFYQVLLTGCICALQLEASEGFNRGSKTHLYYQPRCQDKATILNTCFDKSSHDLMFYLNRTGYGISEEVIKEKCIALRSNMSSCIKDFENMCRGQLGKIYDADIFGSSVFFEALCDSEIPSTAHIRHEDCILAINDDFGDCREEYLKEKGSNIKQAYDICCSNNYVSSCLKKRMDRKCVPDSAERISKALNALHFSDACDDVLCSKSSTFYISVYVFLLAVIVSNFLRV